MNQSTKDEGVNSSIMREKEGERVWATTRAIPVFFKGLAFLHSVLVCSQSRWRTRVITSQTLPVPPPCTGTWTAIISR